MNRCTALLADERGSALVEYALVLTLLAVAMVGALTLLSTGIQAALTNVASQLTAAQTSP